MASKEDCAAKMGAPLGPMVHRFWNECVLLHWNWDEFVSLSARRVVLICSMPWRREPEANGSGGLADTWTFRRSPPFEPRGGHGATSVVSWASASRRLGRHFRRVRKTRRNRSPYLIDSSDPTAAIRFVRKTSVFETRGCYFVGTSRFSSSLQGRTTVMWRRSFITFRALKALIAS